MDTGSKGFTKRRLSIAFIAAVCLVAAMVLPATAYASATWMGEYPVPGAEVHMSPSVVAVDVFGLTAKTATITVGTKDYRAHISQGSAKGYWTTEEAESPRGFRHLQDHVEVEPVYGY